ncbi:HD-GYP domain-containing protein [Streptomyces sp. NBC_01538]|uniref:HD-GYP domain-containing protein n=1 Tax=Streptomyces sp. NBC_01538 TaxID=2903897 RepID=UPI0038685D41
MRTLVHTTAALLTLVSLAHTLWSGLDERAVALSFGLLVLLGELTRWSGPESREAAPLAAAGALSYALLGEDAGRATHHGALQVVTVVVAATLVGCVPHVARGQGPTADHLARRVLTAGFAAVCFQPLYNQGVFDAWGGPGTDPGPGPVYVLLLVALLGLTSLCDAVLAAALAHARTGWPFGPLLRDELRAMLGIGTAVCATGVVMALAVAVIGLWALPVFSLPLLLTQFAFRRYAAVRATYRQTIASLARATEIAGYTPAGHARRVAVLSLAVGRELGLSEPELTVLEYAALMHDIGQLSLVDPVPAGATAALPVAEQRRIALLGGAVVRQTGVAAAVAVVVERQADPYREQPVSACVVRAVNAYEEMVRDAGAGGPLRALEELRLGTGRDYRPEVVESLARVLARNGGLVHERMG